MNFYKNLRWKSKREKILRRDQYLCQECKRYGKRTPANTIHHMNPFRERPDLRLTNWNLISFCTKCHGKMHDRETNELTLLGEQWREKAVPPT